MTRYNRYIRRACNIHSALFCVKVGLVITLIITFVILIVVLSLKIQRRRYSYFDWSPGGGIRHSVDGHEFIVYNFTRPSNLTGQTMKRGSDRHPYYYLRKSFNISSELIGEWIKNRAEFCDGKFVGHANLFAKLSNVVVDPEKGTGRRGGETIDEVIGQSEDIEYFNLSKGYFSVLCKDDNISYFKNNDHLHAWTNAVRCHSYDVYKLPELKIIRKITIAIQRYEYANLYHTMTDYYNTFLTMFIYNIRPGKVNILWIDGHAEGNLDSTWGTLFGSVIRAGDIGTPIFFKTLIWNMMGYNSPLNEQSGDHVPYLEEFRHFFLKRHNIEPYRKLDCTNIAITFIWRRDYVAHPRNAQGKIERKIKNEEELVTAVQKQFPQSTVRGLQIDLYSMEEQLHHVTTTDVLIGMHGAGLTHALFLQSHAALVELLPEYYPAPHFHAIARWRGIRYTRWSNNKMSATKNGYTTVPPKVVVAMTKELINSMCPSQTTSVQSHQ